jgi:hypothetical protein
MRRNKIFRPSTVGKPMSQTKVLRRSLHPILKEIGAEKAGFLAMR